jgi:hypothetical protein
VPALICVELLSTFCECNVLLRYRRDLLGLPFLSLENCQCVVYARK